jgi:uncharacterized zinc-type alcohol dehydrogenase-like protein
MKDTAVALNAEHWSPFNKTKGTLMDTLVESKATLQTPAYAAKSAKTPLAPWSIERRNPGAHDVLIDILYCGVCHSDLHQARDEWGGSIFPMVPGHEIVGTVVETGDHVSKWQRGDTVGVGCFVDSDRTCEACRAGEEQYCESGMTQTYNSYERDGKTPTYGGYSTRITVDENYVLRIPEGIPLERAAPLLCAGITTYSPLKHFGLKPGDKLGVVGLGGLGHMAVKLGHAFGAHVTVLSHSPGKREDALRRRTKASSRTTPGASTSSSTRSRPSMTTTPISTCLSATASWCWWVSPTHRLCRPFLS